MKVTRNSQLWKISGIHYCKHTLILTRTILLSSNIIKYNITYIYIYITCIIFFFFYFIESTVYYFGWTRGWRSYLVRTTITCLLWWLILCGLDKNNFRCYQPLGTIININRSKTVYDILGQYNNIHFLLIRQYLN